MQRSSVYKYQNNYFVIDATIEVENDIYGDNDIPDKPVSKPVSDNI